MSAGRHVGTLNAALHRLGQLQHGPSQIQNQASTSSYTVWSFGSAACGSKSSKNVADWNPKAQIVHSSGESAVRVGVMQQRSALKCKSRSAEQTGGMQGAQRPAASGPTWSQYGLHVCIKRNDPINRLILTIEKKVADLHFTLKKNKYNNRTSKELRPTGLSAGRERAEPQNNADCPLSSDPPRPLVIS